MDYKRIYIIYKRWSENRIIVQPKEIVAKESTGAVYKQWIEEQVIFAFVLSIVIHGSIYLSYGELKKLDWKGQDKIMQMLFPSSKLQIKFNPSKHLNNKLAFLQKLLDKVTPPPQNKKTLTEPPLLFVSVPPPTQAAPEPPKNTQFYSEKNSIAANPEIEKDTNKTKTVSKQDKAIQPVDIPKTIKPEPKPVSKPQVVLQPKSEPKPKPEPKQEIQQNQGIQIASLKPDAGNKVKQESGNTAQSKPVQETTSASSPLIISGTQSGSKSNQQAQSRPLTTAETGGGQQTGAINGEKTKKEGGIRRASLTVSTDTKGAPFSSYDTSLFSTIQQRWYNLIDNAGFTIERHGKVIISFRLHYDGRITDLKVLESEVGEVLALLCRKSIEDPAPFQKWPSDMLRTIGKNYREICIAFYYL